MPKTHNLGQVTSVCVDFESTILGGIRTSFHNPAGYLSIVKRISSKYNGTTKSEALEQANRLLIDHDVISVPREWELDCNSIFDSALDCLGDIDCSADTFKDEFLASFQRTYKISPSINRGLQQVRALGIKIGCVWDVPWGMLNDDAWSELYDTQLSDLIDQLVVSTDVGVRRPDPGCYFALCERMELSPKKMIYVGCYDDMWQAAYNYNFRSIVLHGARPIDVPAHLLQISQFDALAELLSKSI